VRLVLALLLLLLAPAAFAATSPDEMLADPVLEARARALGQELRCLVCQNQSIDDSDADLAKDLRRIVRERLVRGDGDQAIRDYLVARYGDFVLLRPPVRPSTWLLWFGPLAIGLGGAAMIALHLRRRQASSAPQELDPAERARLDRLLADADRPGP
jgi:cytochrome c-type biogenesis protein CcmH